MNKQAYFKMMFPQEMLKIAAQEKQDKEARKAKKKEQKARNKAENQASKSQRKTHGKYHSELIGNFTAPAVTGVGGGVLGALAALLSNTDVAKGAAIGAGTGLGLGGLAQSVGSFSGLIAGPRSLARQNKYDSSTGQTIGNYLVPGMAGWNATRTLATNIDEQPAVLRELLLREKLKNSGLA